MDLPALLKKYEIKASPEVQEKIYSHIRTLVINVCSMLATLALVYNSKTKKVTPKIIKQSIDYVKNICYPQLAVKKGGSYVIDSDYFGQASAGYTEGATQTELAETIDFANNTARAQIGGCGCAGAVQMGGASYEITEFSELVLEELKKDSFLGVDLIPIFASYETTISDSSLEIVKQLIKLHLNCFMYDLKQLKGTLTVKKVEAVAAKRSHSILN